MALGSLRLQREHEGKDGKNEHLTKVKLCPPRPSLRRENIGLPRAMIAVAIVSLMKNERVEKEREAPLRFLSVDAFPDEHLQTLRTHGLQLGLFCPKTSYEGGRKSLQVSLCLWSDANKRITGI